VAPRNESICTKKEVNAVDQLFEWLGAIASFLDVSKVLIGWLRALRKKLKH